MRPAVQMVLSVGGGWASELVAGRVFGLRSPFDGFYGAIAGVVFFLWFDLERRFEAERDRDLQMRLIVSRLDAISKDRTEAK